MLIFLIVVVFIDLNDTAEVSHCLSTGEVCTRTLDPNPSVTSADVSWARGLITALINGFSNNLLTIAALAFVSLFVYLATLICSRLLQSWKREQPRESSRKSGRGDRALAALNSIDSDAEELQTAVDRIRLILGESIVPSQPNHTLNDILRSAGREPPKPDAQQILMRIAKEVAGVISNLTGIRQTISTVKSGSQGWTPATKPSASSNAEIRRLESIAEHKSRQVDEQRAEIEILTKQLKDSLSELDLTKKESEAGLRAKSEANSLLETYAAELPSFVGTREEGAHFPTFRDFLSHANSYSPEEASRLGVMLRVVASALLRNENNFELVWGIHEVGRSLYATMQSLGYNENGCHEEASAWACALNKYGQGKFTIFIPAERSAFSSLEMTGGTPQTTVKEIKSWGVRNKLGDVERKAIVK
jgi:hypothetical protein